MCPICEGEHMVEKKSQEGKVCFYKDRLTAIREPCSYCNGTGVICKRREL